MTIRCRFEPEMTMKKSIKKLANVFFAFVLAFTLCPIAPSSARAEDGGGARPELTTGAGARLSPQAEGDASVTNWASLQEAINRSTPDAPVVLACDIVAGDGDKSLRIDDWVLMPSI